MKKPHFALHLDVEARRIADELVKLHKAGAIKSEQDASFYANLVYHFGAPALLSARGRMLPKPKLARIATRNPK